MCSCIIDCLNCFQGKINVREIYEDGHPEQNIIYGEIIVQLYPGQSDPGKAASVQLYSSSKIDPGELIITRIIRDSLNKFELQLKI